MHRFLVNQRNFLLPVFIGLLIFGCAKDSEKNISQSKISVSQIKFDNVFNETSSFRLELTDSSIIGIPRALVIRDDGSILVTDVTITKKLFLFDSLGNFVKVIGKKGSGPGEYMEPSCISVDKRNNIYLVDNTLRRMNEFNVNGTFLRAFSLPSPVAQIAIDSAGVIYIDQQHNLGMNIYMYSKGGELISKINCSKEIQPFAPGYEGGMALDDHNDLYWINPMTHEVLKSYNGKIIDRFNEESSLYISPSKLNQNQPPAPSWYSTFSHIIDLCYIRNGFLISTILNPTKNDQGDRELPSIFMELYNIDGKILNVFKPPRAITAVHGKFFYTMTLPEEDSNGKILNPKIIKYDFIKK